MSKLENASVRRVREALLAADTTAEVLELAETARTAADAAAACGVEVGAIVKTLVFMVGERPVIALIAGDRRCREAALPAAANLEGPARRASADEVRQATGYAIGGVSPLGHGPDLPILVDESLGRFSRLYAAAGHPHCVFPTTFDSLVRMTGGRVARELAG